MQSCPYCGFRNRAGQTICQECHQSLPVAPHSVPTPPQAAPTGATPPASAPTVLVEPGVIPKSALWIKIGCGIGAFVIGCCILLIIIGALNPPVPTEGVPITTSQSS